eukprot:s1311_g12.t1
MATWIQLADRLQAADIVQAMGHDVTSVTDQSMPIYAQEGVMGATLAEPDTGTLKVKNRRLTPFSFCSWRNALRLSHGKENSRLGEETEVPWLFPHEQKNFRDLQSNLVAQNIQDVYLV